MKMKCEDCRLLIEEYLDLELPPNSASEVGEHLAACPACAAEARGLQLEQETYTKYQPTVQVSPAMWPSIRQRIANDPVQPRNFETASFWSRLGSAVSLPRMSGWATAGLVIFAIVATAFFMKYLQRPSAPQLVAATAPAEVKPATPVSAPTTIPEPSAAVPSSNKAPRPKREFQPANASKLATLKQFPTVAVKSPNQLVKEAEQKYLTAIAMLSRSAGPRRSRMNRETLARLDQAIAAIDRTIAGTRRAVRQHPDDPFAVQYMLTAYARKVDVLREMSAY
jgi:anti-sigma factor RsiW